MYAAKIGKMKIRKSVVIVLCTKKVTRTPPKVSGGEVLISSAIMRKRPAREA